MSNQFVKYIAAASLLLSTTSSFAAQGAIAVSSLKTLSTSNAGISTTASAAPMKITRSSIPVARKMALSGKDAGAGNGGDVETERKNLLRKYIGDLSGLKSDLTRYFAQVKASEISDSDVAKMISMMIANQVETDIGNSSYRLSDVCIDETGIERSSTTLQGVLGAEVCFNLTRLSKRDTSEAELIGLAAHEESRHFGLDDTEHNLASYVTSTALKFRESNLALDSDSGDDVKGYFGNYFLKGQLSQRIYLQVDVSEGSPDCARMTVLTSTEFGTDMAQSPSSPMPIGKPVPIDANYYETIHLFRSSNPNQACHATVSLFDSSQQLVKKVNADLSGTWSSEFQINPMKN
jgi:hypothetical protein